MKYWTLIAATLICASAPALAAEDDFGTMFTSEAPAGFTDAPSEFADGEIAPHLIEPAAGDYFDSEVQGIEEEPQAIEEATDVEPEDAEEIDL